MEKIWNIRQFAEITGVTVHTLRYYEKIGLLHEVNRDSNGYRQYTEQDLSWVQFLMRLRMTGMPISRMKQFSDFRSQGSATVRSRRELLEEHRTNVLEQLKDLQDNLAKMEEKIAYYKSLEENSSDRKL